MAVTVKVVGDLSKYTDPATFTMEIPGISLGGAVDELVRRNPRLGTELFDEQGRLRYTSLLVLNGQSAAWPRDKDKPIEDGGEVVLTRFYSGG